MRTMRNPMKSKDIAVLRGDPVLLNRIAPVVDQRRHLWQRLEIFWQVRARRKNTFISKYSLTDICGISLAADSIERETLRKRKMKNRTGNIVRRCLIQAMFDNS